VRSYTIRKEYQPLQRAQTAENGDPRRALADDVAQGRLSAEQFRRRYFALVYHLKGRNYQDARRALGCDWRTLRENIDEEFLDALGKRGGPADSPDAAG
jgi:hypothetical protein